MCMAEDKLPDQLPASSVGTAADNFNFILPKVNNDYISQAQVLNIDILRLIIYL